MDEDDESTEGEKRFGPGHFRDGERVHGHEDARYSPPGRGLSPVSPRPISLAHRHRKDIGP